MGRARQPAAAIGARRASLPGADACRVRAARHADDVQSACAVCAGVTPGPAVAVARAAVTRGVAGPDRSQLANVAVPLAAYRDAADTEDAPASVGAAADAVAAPRAREERRAAPIRHRPAHVPPDAPA